MANFSPQAPPLVPVTNIRYGQKKGREVGGHHLAGDLPLHDNDHTYALIPIFRYLSLPTPINDTKYWHVQFLGHFELIWDKIHGVCVQRSHCHVNGAGLKANKFKGQKGNVGVVPGYQRGSVTVHRNTEIYEYMFDS